MLHVEYPCVSLLVSCGSMRRRRRREICCLYHMRSGHLIAIEGEGGSVGRNFRVVNSIMNSSELML
jgi:hypothetical protein